MCVACQQLSGSQIIYLKKILGNCVIESPFYLPLEHWAWFWLFDWVCGFLWGIMGVVF